VVLPGVPQVLDLGNQTEKVDACCSVTPPVDRNKIVMEAVLARSPFFPVTSPWLLNNDPSICVISIPVPNIFGTVVNNYGQLFSFGPFPDAS